MIIDAAAEDDVCMYAKDDRIILRGVYVGTVINTDQYSVFHLVSIELDPTEEMERTVYRVHVKSLTPFIHPSIYMDSLIQL